jgi:ankyrin repeat protein
VQLLLEKRADIKARNNFEWTALHIAAGSGHKAVVQLLLEKGVNTEAKTDSGKTARVLALDNKYKAIARLFPDPN